MTFFLYLVTLGILTFQSFYTFYKKELNVKVNEINKSRNIVNMLFWKKEINNVSIDEMQIQYRKNKSAEQQDTGY